MARSGRSEAGLPEDAVKSNERRVTLRWTGGLAVRGRGIGDAGIILDGDGVGGPSPMEALLLACGACTVADVVSVLEKMRVSLEACRLTVTGTRREEEPRRYVSLRLQYALRGEGLDETKARRAIDLSLDKYCSVMHSLAPDIDISYALDLL